MNDRETVAAIVNGKTVILPLADAVAEHFRLEALKSERELTEDENRIKAALVLVFGTLVIGDGAQRLYDALKD